MNLGDFEQSVKDIDKLKILLPGDKQIKKLEDDLNEIKKKQFQEKKSIFKKGFLSNSNISNNSNEKNENLINTNINEKKKTNSNNSKISNKLKLPNFDENNLCVYFDVLINNNTKLPQKIKIEIFDIFKITSKEIKMKSREFDLDNEFNFVNYFVNAIKNNLFKEKKIEISELDYEKKSFYFKLDEINLLKKNKNYLNVNEDKENGFILFEEFMSLRNSNSNSNNNDLFVSSPFAFSYSHSFPYITYEDNLIAVKLEKNNDKDKDKEKEKDKEKDFNYEHEYSHKCSLVILPLNYNYDYYYNYNDDKKEDVIRDLIIIGRIFYNKDVFKKISEKILSNEEIPEIKIIDSGKSMLV
jgi:hypothetical protein